MRCPFGCRTHHQKSESDRRSTDYYRTDEGKSKKRQINADRSSINLPPAIPLIALDIPIIVVEHLRQIFSRVGRRQLDLCRCRNFFASPIETTQPRFSRATAPVSASVVVTATIGDIYLEASIEIAMIDLHYEGHRMRHALTEKRLLEAILQEGIREPLLGTMRGQFCILVDGFKRLRCAKKLGIMQVASRTHWHQ